MSTVIHARYPGPSKFEKVRNSERRLYITINDVIYVYSS